MLFTVSDHFFDYSERKERVSVKCSSRPEVIVILVCILAISSVYRMLCIIIDRRQTGG